MTLVLVVDDVAPLAEQYAYDLRRTGGYEVLTAPTGEKALEILARPRWTASCSTSRCRAWTASRCLRALERKGCEVPVIVYTGTGSYDRCVQALRLGAYGFIDKAEPMERVVHEIESAMERSRLRAENGRASPSAGPGDLAGGRQRGHGGAPRGDRPGGADPEPGADRGRERDRQGAGGPRSPPARAAARPGRSSPSTAPRSPRAWSRASSSATSGARSPARSAPGRAPSRRRSAGRSSWTRSVSCRSRPRPSSSACSRSGRSPGSAATKPVQVEARIVAATNRDLEAEVPGGPLPRGPLLPAQRCTSSAFRRSASGCPTFRSWPTSS